MNEVSLDQMSAARFAELVGTRFKVQLEPGIDVILELSAVNTPRPNGQERGAPGGAGTESFSLWFDGPADRPLGQRTFRFTHERLGAFDLFIVPVGAEQGARQYEAVFNRCSIPRTTLGSG